MFNALKRLFDSVEDVERSKNRHLEVSKTHEANADASTSQELKEFYTNQASFHRKCADDRQYAIDNWNNLEG